MHWEEVGIAVGSVVITLMTCVTMAIILASTL